MKNYYNILGIPEDAGEKEINEAYKKLAQKFHPDRNPDDEFFASWFKEINEAKQVLGDEDERAAYDFKLSNYADAYELIKQQQAEEKFERSQRRNRYLRARSRRKKWWMAGTIAALLGVAFFLLKDNDNKAFASTDTNDPFLKYELAVQKNNVNIAESSSQEIISTDNLQQKEQQVESTETNTQLVAVKPKPRPASKSKQRAFTNAEIDLIIKKLKAAKEVNCVQILQSSKAGIKADFAIANIIKKHGYIIAGREIIKTNQKGIIVNIHGNIAKVIIGNIKSD